MSHEAGVARPMLAAIRRLARAKVLLAGLDTGPFVLAEAGVLDGYRATCHWESLPGFRESYRAVQVREALFERDRDRMTCAGGAAAIDMMLAWINDVMGRELSVAVADQLVHFRSREQEGQIRVSPRARFGTSDARLLAIIAAMEQQIEEPLPAEHLAKAGGLSVRQMERLFQSELGERPMGFYRALRLERAQHLLSYSHLSVRDVSLATGFSTLAEFSRAFRARAGISPSQFRRGGHRSPDPLPNHRNRWQISIVWGSCYSRGDQVGKLTAAYMIATAAMYPQGDITPLIPPSKDNWCTVGYKVMVPDGREGRVTSVSGDICRVLADGKLRHPIPHYIVEPVYPQDFAKVKIGH